jgi:periplasmic protein CpxP/Spy
MKSKVWVAALLVAATAAALPAQMRRPGLERGPGADRGPGGGRMFAALDLTEGQKAQIAILREQAREETAAMHEQMRELTRTWWEMRRTGDPKAEEVRAEVRNLREEIWLRHAGTRAEIESILTPEQREKLEQMRAERRDRPLEGGLRGPGRRP